MALRELKKVKEAEKAAVRRIETAESKAEKGLEKFRDELHRQREDEIFSLNKNLEHEMEFAQGKARSEARDIEREGDEEVKRLGDAAVKNRDRAVEHVVKIITEV